MEYRNLYHFIHVAQERNFTRAAKKILMSQSALSRSVQNLEDEFGLILIRRSTHFFELTPAGEYLLEQGIKIVNDFEQIEERMKEFANE